MGLRLRGVIRCGRCRKPRGIRHTCVARSGARRGKTRMQSPVTRECGTCHKPRGLRHTCTIGTDFKVRKRRAKRKAATAKRAERRKETRRRQAERRKQAAADRRARDKARKRAAKGKPRSSRPRGDGHEPGTCGNRECPAYRCRIYWQGMDDCPGPHDGG
jgi:hypothetical protein